MSGKPALSVIVPCLNEASNLHVLVDRLGKALGAIEGLAFELVIIDDGSTDETFGIAGKLAAEFTWLVPVKHEVNKGITEGWATGLQACKGDYVLTMDADLQYRPEDIPEMWRNIDGTGYDLVQGWRISNPEGSRIRRGLSRLFSIFLNLLFGTELKDFKSGFILYKRKVLEEIIEDRNRFRYFQHFPTIAAISRGFKLHEVPVVFDARYSGNSFITNAFAFGMKSLVDLPKAWNIYRRKRT